MVAKNTKTENPIALMQKPVSIQVVIMKVEEVDGLTLNTDQECVGWVLLARSEATQQLGDGMRLSAERECNRCLTGIVKVDPDFFLNVLEQIKLGFSFRRQSKSRDRLTHGHLPH